MQGDLSPTPAMNRREFLAGATAAAMALPALASEPAPVATLPRWRGFNLPPFFGTWNSGKAVEEDFALVKELGFDFVRLPMWYTLWTDPKDWRVVKEEVLAEIDRAVQFGAQYGLHVNLNLHRAPGFCIAPEPAEPFDLFTSAEALDAFRFQWELFTKRYENIPSDRLSFNLVNEPKAKAADYERVVRATLETIRAVSPQRTVFIDGNMVARLPMPELRDTGVVQSVHSYDPMPISHYKASWVGHSDTWPVPTWPIMRDGKVGYGRESLEKLFKPWTDLARSGVPVHCGECGCFNQTPHDVFLAWFADVLDILKQSSIGWALWELRGPFGVLDSQRADVQYENWRGHQLDRKLLELLKEN